MKRSLMGRDTAAASCEWIARQIVAGDSLRRGVAKALAGDEEGTLAELRLAAGMLSEAAP